MGIPIPEFKILLYGPSFNPAGIKARARFENGSLAISLRKGSFLVPPHLIALRTGGYDGRQWLITWQSQDGAYSAMLQGEEALEAFAQLAPTEIGRQIQQMRKSHGRRFKPALALLALILLLPLLALGLFHAYADRLADWAVSRISLEQEQQLGDLLFAQMRPSLKLAEQGVASAAVSSIGKRLTDESLYRYRFHIVVDPRINAYALPGGHIVIYTGLIEAADSASEAAGVLAHEISHVELHHALRNMIRSSGPRAVLGVLLGNYSAGVWGNLAEHLGSLNYNRELESEADLEGLKILHRAGVPDNGMENFFAKMAARENALLHLLARHPASDERLAGLRASMAVAPAYDIRPLPVDWEAVKAGL